MVDFLAISRLPCDNCTFPVCRIECENHATVAWGGIYWPPIEAGNDLTACRSIESAHLMLFLAYQEFLFVGQTVMLDLFRLT